MDWDAGQMDTLDEFSAGPVHISEIEVALCADVDLFVAHGYLTVDNNAGVFSMTEAGAALWETWFGIEEEEEDPEGMMVEREPIDFPTKYPDVTWIPDGDALAVLDSLYNAPVEWESLPAEVQQVVEWLMNHGYVNSHYGCCLASQQGRDLIDHVS